MLGLGFNLSQLIFSGNSTFERKLLYQVFECFKIEISFFVVFVICQYCGTVYVYFLLEKNYTLSVYLYYHTFSSVHMKQFVRIVFSRILLDEGHFNR